MNSDYVKIDGKTIVSDEKGNKTIVRYDGDLEKVLIQENIVETIENRINKLDGSIEEYKKIRKKKFIPGTTILFTLCSSILLPFLFSKLIDSNVFVTEIQTVFGPMNQAVLLVWVSSICIIPMGIMGDVAQYLRMKKYKKECQANVTEYEFLCKQLVREKEKLVELTEQNKIQKESSSIEVKKVNDSKAIRRLDNYRQLYSELGYNYDEYFRYYKEGRLEQELKHDYSKDGIELVEEYIKEKGPVLVYKK